MTPNFLKGPDKGILISNGAIISQSVNFETGRGDNEPQFS